MSQSDFIELRWVPKNLDRFIVRKAILHSLKAQLPKFHGALLDVGCGQMPYKQLLTNKPSRITHYIGLDLENNPIHKNRPDITWKNGIIPLDGNSIDCAIATEVFEHCFDPKKILSEIFRVLKPGGIMFFTVPFLWPLHEVPFDCYRYTPFSLTRHLDACGFAEIVLKPLGGWDASIGQMLGLWVRRRAMRKWKRKILSILIMPIIFILYKTDQRTITLFNESTMITGISGTTRKPNVQSQKSN